MKFLNFLILPALLMLTACQCNQEVTIFLAGDSTMSEKRVEKRPETGWGMAFDQFFKENVSIENHAKNGRSTRTFIEEGRWDSLINKVEKGDYVFIQFGHNDQSKHKVGRYTTPDAYYDNLCRFVDDVQQKKATPVLLTSLARRRFNEDGQFYDVHGEYPDLVRKVAKDKEVVLLDVHKSSCTYISRLGEEASKSLFLIADSGRWANYPDGINDNTHFNEAGAEEMAKLVVDALKDSNISLRHYIE